MLLSNQVRHLKLFEFPHICSFDKPVLQNSAFLTSRASGRSSINSCSSALAFAQRFAGKLTEGIAAWKA